MFTRLKRWLFVKPNRQSIIKSHFDTLVMKYDYYLEGEFETVDTHIVAIDVLPNGYMIAAVKTTSHVLGYKCVLKLWDGQWSTLFDTCDTIIRVVSLSNELVVVYANDEYYEVYNLNCLKPLLTGYGKNHIFLINDRIAYSDINVICFFNLRTNRPGDSIILGDKIMDLKPLPNGKIISVSIDGTLQIWDTGHCEYTIEIPFPYKVSVLCNEFITMNHNLFNLKTLTYKWNNISAMAVLNKNNFVIGFEDGRFGIERYCLCTVLCGLTINNLLVLPNNCVLANHEDTTLRVWDTDKLDSIQKICNKNEIVDMKLLFNGHVLIKYITGFKILK